MEISVLGSGMGTTAAAATTGVAAGALGAGAAGVGVRFEAGVDAGLGISEFTNGTAAAAGMEAAVAGAVEIA